MERIRSRSVAGMLRIATLAPSLLIVAQLWEAVPAHAATRDSHESQVARLASSQFEEPLIATASTSRKEDEALSLAIKAYLKRSSPDDFQSLDVFLSDYPRSGWRVALLTNLGLSYYHYGYFSKAIDAWEMAWKAGKPVTEPRGKALVDRAIGELVRMHARLGHAERLEALIKELGSRQVTGPATEALTGAKEGLWMMRHEPGVAYLCGPMALKNLLLSTKAPIKQVHFLDAYRSGPHGVTLAEVAGLADEAKLSYRLVFREANQTVPVPSIVHWKVSHFAAIVGETQGRFHIEDPTFGTDLWITHAALDSESSGYFLVPGEQPNSEWRDVTSAEAAQVIGMGFTGSNDPTATTPQDDTAQGNNPNCGLCGYDFTEMTVSLNLSDTPVGYTPPKGPDVHVKLTYSQREASQPANFSFFNVGQKWTLNWLTYIQDDPTLAGANVMRLVAGGGAVNYTGYSNATGAFTPETRDASVLVRTSGNPITYQRKLSDGSLEVYSRSNGATGYPRLVFLTQLVDPAGNAVSLNYDGQLRLTSLTDATGRSTTFSYGLGSRPLLVTTITDPFGRSAQITYDANGRLSQITDVLGLTSQFSYDASSLINKMVTPYGTTQFAYGSTDGNERFLQATDPLGHTERLEYLQGAPGIPFSDPPGTVPDGIQDPFNIYLNGRNTFYWDKHAYQVAAGDYTKARIKHWTHLATNTNLTTHPVESIKFPFENRIWMNYENQVQNNPGLGTAVSGSLDRPTRIGRVLDDGTTQLTQFTYNSLGRVTDAIDPVGRETQFVYDTNQIDLLQVKQKTSPSGFSTIAQFTYNGQHRPLTYTDAAGQITTYLYNSAGQLTLVTDSLGEVTKYTFDGLGRLTQIVNPNNQTAASFSYDAFDRLASRTDSEGYTVSYIYDALDRLTRQTYPDGTTRQNTWTNLDLTSVKDRQGRTTQYSYDAVRQLVAVTDPLGHVTKTGRFENGLLKTLTDPNNNVTTWNIDVEGRVTSKVYADGKIFTNAYENTTSRLKSVTDPLAQVKQYTWTLDNELAGITYSNVVNATPSVAFKYDPYFRRVTSMTDGSGSNQYHYQPAGALGALKIRQEAGAHQIDNVAYQYDALGRVTARKVDFTTETFAYDSLGRLISDTNELGQFDLNYLGQTAQMTSRQIHGGTLGTTWTYDTNANDRRLKTITNPGVTRSYQYTTTPENLITQIAESASGGSAFAPQTWNYTYDSADRLLQASASGGSQYVYGYDPADNITSSTSTSPPASNIGAYNSLNQITAFGGRPFIYDANGNLTDDGVRTYKWDAENRLINVALKAQPSQNTSFVYDGLGRRVAIVAANGTTSTATHYLWCGRSLCQSRTGNVVARHYYSEGEALPGNGTLLYYTHDHLGSVRDVVAIQTATSAAAFDYDPYGNLIRSAGTVSTDFHYAGMFYEQNSGLYLTRYRIYDPKAGRWLSRDPIGEAGGANTYAYVRGRPLSRTDRLGLCTNWWLVGGGLGILGVAIVAEILSDGVASPEALPLAEEALAEVEAGLGAEGAEGTTFIEGAEGAQGATEGDIQFGRVENQITHTFRHLDEAGIDRQAVSDAITQDLTPIKQSLPEGQLYKGTVDVNGTRIDYNAFKLPNGKINVGRITVPQP
jgi:RHS repeat-associated protein